MNFRVRRLCLLLVCLLLACSIPLSVMAEGLVQPQRESSLTLHYAADTQPIPGAKIQMFYLASVDASVNFTLTDRFSGYPIQVDHLTAEGWKELALVLKGYVLSDKLEADYKGETDGSGDLRFTGLKTGLYLILGEKTAFNGFQYNMEPTIVSVPANVNHLWVYDVTVLPKLYPTVPVSDIRVIKAWDDKGNESKRPGEITIRLFQNERLFDTVTLGKANDWSCQWRDLPEKDEDGRGIEWSISEDPIENYKTQIRQSGKDFVVTNTYNGTVPSGSRLPQTGQLWWPVTVLSFLGLCFIAIGALLSRRKDSQ